MPTTELVTASQQDDILALTSVEAQDAKWADLLEEQEALEQTCTDLGVERFANRLVDATETSARKALNKGRASTTGANKKLFQEALAPVTEAVLAFLDEQRKKRGVKHTLVRILDLYVDEAIETLAKSRKAKETKKSPAAPISDDDRRQAEREAAEVCAYFTIKTVLDSLAHSPPVRMASLKITDYLIHELRYRRFRTLAPGLFNYRLNSFRTTSYAHMARSMDATWKKAVCEECRKASKEECRHLAFPDLDVAQSQRILLGTKLLDLCFASTGIATINNERKTNKTGWGKFRDELNIVATPETEEWVAKRNNMLALMAPVRLPMIVPPLQWGPGHVGGYRFNLRGAEGLIRGRLSQTMRERLNAAEMPTVYAALNAIQNTAWRINVPVFDVVEALYQQGGGVCGVPSFEKIPEPTKQGYDLTDPEQLHVWKKAASDAKEKEVQRQGKAIAFGKLRAAVLQVKDHGAIFFPHNLDFRGRVYPITTFLSPQGEDLSKGLLTFSRGRPLGPDGASWLAIHGANTFDKLPDGRKASQMTFAERIQWVVDHSEDICQSADDPMGHRWWMNLNEKGKPQGEPFQFLAFCIEWRNYWRIATTEGSEAGEQYVCSLPVAQDGSCNGLQHFSAMLRDPVGAKAVNVIPQERPQDIYQVVADNVLGQLEETQHENDLAHLWLGSKLVNRSLTKRPTMTFGYGSKEYGFRTQLYEYLHGHEDHFAIRDHFTINEVDARQSACDLMSKCIMDALRSTVKAAAQGMEWFQKSARVIIQSGNPVEWVVPVTGFPVRQEYYEVELKQIKTILAGKIIQPRVYNPTPDLEVHRQANAIAPNVVHSMDAAALMLTVTHAEQDGVESFGAIHDSYATVPGDMTVLARCTRESFVHLYTKNDVVADFYRQFQEQATDPSKLPAPPEMGTLDVSQVLLSDYFFA